MLAGFAVASYVSVASLSAAAAGTPATIVTVNSEKLFAQSKVGQSVREQVQTLSKNLRDEGTKAQDGLETEAKALRAQGQKIEQALQAEAKKLGEQRGLLKEDDFAKKVQAFQKKEANERASFEAKGAAFQKKEQDTQRSFQEKSVALQNGTNVARAQIEEALRPIFAKVLEAHGANLMLDQSYVLAGGTDLDATADVVKELDAKVTKIVVKPVAPSAQK
jgi:Skp family chaperone for outer membrane proteins